MPLHVFALRTEKLDVQEDIFLSAQQAFLFLHGFELVHYQCIFTLELQFLHCLENCVSECKNCHALATVRLLLGDVYFLTLESRNDVVLNSGTTSEDTTSEAQQHCSRHTPHDTNTQGS